MAGMLNKYLAERRAVLMSMTNEERCEVAKRMLDHAAEARTRYALGATPDELREAAAWVEALNDVAQPTVEAHAPGDGQA